MLSYLPTYVKLPTYLLMLSNASSAVTFTLHARTTIWEQKYLPIFCYSILPAKNCWYAKTTLLSLISISLSFHSIHSNTFPLLGMYCNISMSFSFDVSHAIDVTPVANHFISTHIKIILCI